MTRLQAGRDGIEDGLPMQTEVFSSQSPRLYLTGPTEVHT
jgi:hypothetical protein